MARKKKARSSKGRGGLLEKDQQREILAVGLLALSLFTFVALLPLSLFGARAVEWFPSGNPVGSVGRAVDAGLVSAFGVSSGLIPLLLALAGLHLGGWLTRERASRVGALAAGLLVLVPVGLYVLAPTSETAGWLGETLGLPLVAALGWLGAILLLGALLVVLLVATLHWNPVRTVGAGVAHGGTLVGRLAQWSGDRLRSWKERSQAKPMEAPGTMPDAEGEPDPFDESAEAEPLLEREPVREADPAEPDPFEPEPEPDATEPPAAEPSLGPAELPPIDLLTLEDGTDRQDMERELDRLGEILVEKLRTFNVESELGGRTTGPMVTQFEVIPAPGVKVNRISNLDADLALAMKAQSVRIVAPIPGKGAVGVEIPNPSPQIVYLREILASKRFQNAKGVLPLALGKDLTGRPYVADLAKMPHALIAGATGSGKSVCINTIITSLACKHTPETLRLLMIDPKMVELSTYADLPHLRHPVVTDPRDAAGVLKWAVFEMERRYQILSANGVRSIAEFNARFRDGKDLYTKKLDGDEADPERWLWDEGVMPYVVVVVDELADLMMTVQNEVEKPLAQLAQKARAIGIHLIVATQRPSVNVITGLIKANFPTRIAFRVASKTDSRTILDQNGAEALLGNGDMLFLPPGQGEPVRLQGAYLATEDTDALVSWYRERREAKAAAADEADILEELKSHEMEEATSVIEEIKGDWDELFRAAAEVCIQHEQGSTSLLQRRLKVGYGRAARIVDQLHDAGIVGPPDGSKPREVLVGLDELDAICGPG